MTRRGASVGRAVAAGVILVAVLGLGLGALGCAHVQVADAIDGGSWHRLAPGETLSQVASRYHVSVDELVQLNAIADRDHVQAGVEIFVPSAASVRAAAQAQRHPRASRSTRAPALRVAHEEQRAPSRDGGLGRLARPVDGPITSRFGFRDGRPHQGIDLSVPDGTPVRAAESGQVVYAGERLRGYGRLVMVRHDAHLVTIYAHNEALLVVEGQAVSRGAVLARSGHTGHVTAPHVHFEVREDSVPRDPEPYLGLGTTAPIAQAR